MNVFEDLLPYLKNDNDVSLNAKYLSDALAVISTEQVSFSMSGKLNPCVLRPVGEGAPEYLHVIMPLRST